MKVLNTKTGCKYMWSKEKFMVRQEYMRNMYEEFMETGKVPNWNQVGYRAAYVGISLWPTHAIMH